MLLCASEQCPGTLSVIVGEMLDRFGLAMAQTQGQPPHPSDQQQRRTKPENDGG